MTEEQSSGPNVLKGRNISGWHPLDNQHCFLCGEVLAKENLSQEHVIPIWAQNKFNLWDKKLTLINRTEIPYRQLKVPCCKVCNNIHLAKLENTIKPFALGQKNPADLPSEIAYQWCAKILIAIIYKELQLPLDRSSLESEKIHSKDFLDEFSMCHFFLQSIRKPFQFHCLDSDFPASVFRFRTKTDQTDDDNFDLITNIMGQSIGIRIGQLGLIVVCDGGLQELFKHDSPQKYGEHNLHPIQFREICAQIHYKAALRDATYFYVISESPEVVSVNQIKIVPFSNELTEDGEMVVFKDWSQRVYSHILGHFIGIDPSELYEETTDRVNTFLKDDEGNFADLSI